VRWPWTARRVAPDLFDDDTWHALAIRNVQIARASAIIRRRWIPLGVRARRTS
jgi:hypothetical protein